MRNLIALAVGACGLILIVMGVIDLLGDEPSDNAGTQSSVPATVAATTLAELTTTTITPPTVAPVTQAAPTTAPPATTTTVATTTTTLLTEMQTVEDFFADYVAAIGAGDVDFLFERLHPVVLAQPNAELCRAFIEREILALENYQIDGDITGPISQVIAGTTVDELFSVPISFVFQGQSFTSVATFAGVDSQMHWFTECR